MGLPPAAGACGEVSPTVVRARRRRRPGRACGRAVDRGPRWGKTLCVFPRCALPVRSYCELLSAIVSCTLSTCVRLRTWSGCARPWDRRRLLHLVAAICLSMLFPWAGMWLVLYFRRMLTAFCLVLLVFF